MKGIFDFQLLIFDFDEGIGSGSVWQ